MKELNHVHLNGLRALESCGRLGSLKAAAGELGVTVGAVSQQVIRAEGQLGRMVFERTPQGLRPTTFGAGFLQRLSAAFALLEQAVAEAADRSQDVLTISVAPVLASKWLVPRLGRYAAANPSIRLRLEATIALVDPATSDIDMAIRVGPGGWPGVRTELLLHQEVFPVCAPAIAERLSGPEDLLEVPVMEDANSNLSWQRWFDHLGLDAGRLKVGSSFTDAAMALDAVIGGQGMMLGWQTLCEAALAAGTVVAPFPRRVATGMSYWLITAPDRAESKKVRDFKEWLRKEVAETERRFAGPK